MRERCLVKVVDVIDGDTITILKGFIFRRIEKIRIARIDTPEKSLNAKEGIDEYHKETGKRVGAYLRSKLLGKRVYISTPLVKHKSGYTMILRDSFGRLLSEVYTISLTNISDHLLSKGLAKQYKGGVKNKWSREDLEKVNIILDSLQTK
jgi:endonuclease YncB( thermonuclease family)